MSWKEIVTILGILAAILILVSAMGCETLDQMRRRGSYVLEMDPNAQHRHAGDGHHHED